MGSSERMKAIRVSDPVRALVRLRTWAMVVLLLLVLLARLVLGAELPFSALSILFAVAALSNLALARWGQGDAPLAVAAVGVFDTVLLTFFLAFSGGPANPLSVLYLIVVTLTATLTRPVFTWVVVALSSGGYAITFFWNVSLPEQLGGHHAHHGHHGAYSVHMQGMWLAYTLAAITIALFVSRLSESLRREREERARAARLLGLATLAAGAAHEIGNPLGTIRLAASELLGELEARNASADELEDLRLIDAEIGRAQQVLERMAIGAGELMGEAPVPVAVPDLVGQATLALGEGASRVTTDLPDALPRVRWPVHATAQVLTQLFRNGLEATASEEPVSCRARSEGDGVSFEIRDRGSGMSDGVLERLGEPFFTTRPGQGMGLGMFIARSLAEHLGGRLSVASTEGQGTVVRLWLPVEVGR